MSVNYSIVIPVYGSENALEKLHQSIVSFFADKYSYEIIYVDDASADNSWEVLKKKKKTSGNHKVKPLGKNFGQPCATGCRFQNLKRRFYFNIY